MTGRTANVQKRTDYCSKKGSFGMSILFRLVQTNVKIIIRILTFPAPYDVLIFKFAPFC